MSGEDITAVLLPASGVDFFLTDDNSFKIADKLKSDWRFARVNTETSKEGMQGAIEYYKNRVSPELIVIETDDIGDKFLSELEELSSLCTEGTDAVIIGPKNDVKLYRDLMEMGVKDYLVRPIDEEDLVKVVAKSLIEKKGVTGSKLVSVLGSKGGVGVTTVAQLLAQDIANNIEQKTMLMDMAGTVSSLGITFGVNSTTKLNEAVVLAAEGSEEDMDRICQSISDNLSLLTFGGEPLLAKVPDPDKAEILVNRLMKRYPVVVLDLSCTSREVKKRIIEISSEVVVVSNALMSSLRNTKVLLAEIKRARTSLNEVDLVLNMQGIAEGEEVPLQDIKTALDFEPTITVKYLPKLFLNAETSATPIQNTGDGKKIMSEIRSIASKVVEVKLTDKGNKKDDIGFMGKLKNMFKE